MSLPLPLLHAMVLRVLLILSCLLLASCSQRPKGVDLILINGDEPQSLDPGIITGQIEMRLCNALFEGLTARDAHGVSRPACAERWDVSSDRKVYTFYLRPHLRWSDGTPLTALDFQESWRRVLEPSTGSKYSEILFFVKNAENYRTGKIKDFSQVGVKALDEKTLRVELENPTPFFDDLVAFTTYSPVPMHVIKKYGDSWIKPGKMVSNGAYQLKGWRMSDRVELEKNPYYWRKETVHLNRIDALAVSKGTTAFNLFATGQADLMLDKGLIPPMLVGELSKRADFHANPFLATYFYRFNVTRPPFDDPRVRKAFAMSIQKQTIIDKITRGGEQYANSITPPGIEGYQPPQGVEYDPGQARKLLTEAGYPNGKGFPRVTILYNKSDLNEPIATEIQAMWKKELNVEVGLRLQEWGIYLQSLDDLDFDIARSSWVGDYNDPNTFLDCFMADRGNNRTGWKNPVYDQLMLKANTQSDPAKRFAMMQEAEKILVEKEVPIIPLYFYVGIVMYDDHKFGGIYPNVVDEHPLREIYRKEGRKP